MKGIPLQYQIHVVLANLGHHFSSAGLARHTSFRLNAGHPAQHRVDTARRESHDIDIYIYGIHVPLV